MKILAYFIIPVYTVLFTRGYNWFTTNFSVIGNIFDRKLAFFVWGMIVGGYFYMIYRRVKSLVRMKPACACLMPSALALLFCAITTPYLPDELPLKSFLHIVFAFISTVLLVLFLLAAVRGQRMVHPGEYGGYLAGLAAIVGVSAVLLVLAGIVSSALEIFITLTTVIFSERLTAKMSRTCFR
ncbi:MAG: hypothetical protein LIP16_19635 [Clostridium sp.]|nr:hypothetical protein [Clostridium sp.]